MSEVPVGNFGRTIRKLRTEAELNQATLAKKAGISQSAVSQIEKGERAPSFDVLRSLATALGVSAAELLGPENADAPTNQEKVHFRQYRALPEEARDELETFMRFLRDKHRP